MATPTVHSISDSDSDVTIEPDTQEVTHNSPDLFDSSDIEETNEKLTMLRKKNKSFEEGRKKSIDKKMTATKNNPAVVDTKSTLTEKKLTFMENKLMCLKQKSTDTHDLSDSDSEMEKIKEKILTLKTISTMSEKVSSQKDVNHKPLCKFGSKCYRKNHSHLAEFSHDIKQNSPSKRKIEDDGGSSSKKRFKIEKSTLTSTSSRNEKTCDEIYKENQPFSFYLTKVTGISDDYNKSGAVHIRDILSESMGKLVASCQFNYMYDIDWLVNQYPKEFRSKPLLLVHGEQQTSQANLQLVASKYPNITLCQARLSILYGTHHTKMMLLLYENGFRVVITTANAVAGDWHQKTQGVWISPVFPKLPGEGDVDAGESPTNFKRDLIKYLAAYTRPKLTQWEKHIKAHDLSAARVFLIGSVPGRHTEREKDSWGHLKLRKVLQKHGPQGKNVKDWPIIGQFSSIGSLGPTEGSWVCGEWLTSLTASQGLVSPQDLSSKLQLIFPSVENIRVSLEGYGAGSSVPYSIQTAQKQKYVHQYFRQWKSEGRGRSRASPHIKTYIRPNPEFNKASWFLVTSANLSKAAWGALEKNGVQLMIRSYEIGVLFLPQLFGGEETFDITSDINKALTKHKPVFPLPYDLPPSRYEKGDRPWMWDVPCVHLPDTHGNKYCPPMK